MDVLKFFLKLDSDSSGALKLVSALGKVDRYFQRNEKSIKMVERSLRMMGRAGARTIGTIGKGFRAAGRHIGGFARDALSQFTAFASWDGMKAIARGLVSMTGAMIETSTSAARTSRGFKVLFGTEAAMVEQRAEFLSRFTDFDDDVIKNFAAGVKQAGVATKDWETLFRAAADMATLPGAGPERLGEIQSAFEAMALKGEVTNRTFMGLAVNVDKFWASLGARIGKTAVEAEAMAQKHLIPITVLQDEVLKTMQANMGGKPLGTLAFQAGKDPAASLRRVQRGPGDLMKGLADSPEMKSLGQQFERIAALFDPESPSGKRMLEGMKGFTGKLAKMLERFDFEKFTMGILKFATDLIPVVEKLASAASKLAGIFGTDDKPRVYESGPKKGQERDKSFLDFGLTAEESGPLSTRQRKEAAEGFEAVNSTWFGKWLKSFAVPEWKEVIQGQADGMRAGIPIVEKAATEVAGAGQAATVKKDESHSPSRVYRHFGLMGAEGYAQGWESGVDRIERAATSAMDIPTPSTAPQAIAKGGPVAVSAPITINVTGGEGMDAAELARRLQDILPGQLQAAFENMRLETGVA